MVQFLTAADIPDGGVNNFCPEAGYTAEEVFCSGKVLYAGQPVGLIVAGWFFIQHSHYCELWYNDTLLVKILFQYLSHYLYSTSRLSLVLPVYCWVELKVLVYPIYLYSQNKVLLPGCCFLGADMLKKYLNKQYFDISQFIIIRGYCSNTNKILLKNLKKQYSPHTFNDSN